MLADWKEKENKNDQKNDVSFELSGPYKTRKQQVLPEWIDYNGHMNVAYYTLAFDKSLDFFFEDILGIGPTYVSKMSKTYVLDRIMGGFYMGLWAPLG